MEVKKFSKDFCICYYNVNMYKEATITSLLNFLQETAICHSDSIGFGMDSLMKQKAAWILNRWSVEIERYPAWDETITVETWPSAFERFYANREFLVKDSERNIITRAASLWVFLDMDKKRPKRIPEELGTAYGVVDIKALENPFTDPAVDGDMEFTRDFYVRRSDIDTNNHVNNISYVDWLLEAVPGEIYEHSRISSLEIIYKKETLYGSAIKSMCKKVDADNSTTQFSHRITDSSGEIEHASGKTSWSKRRILK